MLGKVKTEDGDFPVVSREMCKLIRGLLTYVIDYPSHTEDRALRLRGRTPSAV